MASPVPLRALRQVRRTERPDPHSGSQGHARSNRKRVEHDACRLADGDDVNRRCGLHGGHETGFVKGVMNEAAGIGGIERRMQDGVQVVAEVWNGAGQ